MSERVNSTGGGVDALMWAYLSRWGSGYVCTYTTFSITENFLKTLFLCLHVDEENRDYLRNVKCLHPFWRHTVRHVIVYMRRISTMMLFSHTVTVPVFRQTAMRHLCLRFPSQASTLLIGQHFYTVRIIWSPAALACSWQSLTSCTSRWRYISKTARVTGFVDIHCL